MAPVTSNRKSVSPVAVPARPEISLALVLAYLPILVAMVRDQRRYGKIHPVWLYLGPALVIEQSLEVAFFGLGAQRQLGLWLYAFLT